MRTRLSTVESTGLLRLRRCAFVAVSLLLTATVSFGAAACGGGSASSDKGSTGGRKLPGIKEFGLTEEQYAAHIEEVQALIAKCMAEAGFEYIPASVQQVALAQANVRKQGSVLAKRKYKEKWGYDVTTRYENKVKNIELGSRNLRYIQSLSEADKIAYERALYGDDPNATFAFTFDEEDFSTTGGCTRKAVEQVFTKEQLSENYQHPKDILIEKDPRVIEANANWVACMQSHGYDGYLDQDEIIDEFEERFQALVGDQDPRTLTGSKLQRLKKMQREEVAISLADLDCETKYVDSVIREVEIEIFGVPVSG